MPSKPNWPAAQPMGVAGRNLSALAQQSRLESVEQQLASTQRTCRSLEQQLTLALSRLRDATLQIQGMAEENEALLERAERAEALVLVTASPENQKAEPAAAVREQSPVRMYAKSPTKYPSTRLSSERAARVLRMALEARSSSIDARRLPHRAWDHD